jgi:TonB family protein
VPVNLRLVALVPLALAAACATNPRTRVADRRSPAGSVGCLDTLRAADSITAIVKMTVAAQDTQVILPKDFEAMFVEGFRSRFRVPSKLPLSVVTGTEPCDSLGSRCAGGMLSVGVIAYATAHEDGKLSDIDIVDLALTPGLADSVNSALRSMSRGELVPPTGDAESVPLVLKIAPEENPDSVPSLRYVFRARVPRYDAPFSYPAMPVAGVDAKYPFTARLAGAGDSVTIAFTVDSDGMIAPESLELVSAKYRDFVASVVEALGKTRYHPAHLGDCAVATRIQQRFLFKVPE